MLLYIQKFLFFSVTRDEQNAGKIDEMLAQLEFICLEESGRNNVENKNEKYIETNKGKFFIVVCV